jgi:hypothetical protein
MLKQCDIYICMGMISMLFLCSCFYDSANTRTEKVVGNIYAVEVIYPNYTVFGLNFYKRNNNGGDNLLDGRDYIDYIKGNDSLLLVKSISESGTTDSSKLLVRFYKIYHREGKKIVSIIKVTDRAFYLAEQQISVVYSFKTK